MKTETIERITPAKTALLVMDYQHGTLGRLPGAGALLTQIHDRVAPRDGDIVVRKVRVGPFGAAEFLISRIIPPAGGRHHRR
jgi:hypothetical protein